MNNGSAPAPSVGVHGFGFALIGRAGLLWTEDPDADSSQGSDGPPQHV